MEIINLELTKEQYVAIKLSLADGKHPSMVELYKKILKKEKENENVE